jgi:hypothetical protein
MKSAYACLLFLLPLLTHAQQIQYTDPEQEDGRKTAFEIIGKVGGNILVMKNNHSSAAISVYGDDMKLIQRVPLGFLPEKFLDVDFIQYPEFCYMIYEYQKKNVLHCSLVKLDRMARVVGETVDLDTTQISFAANNKIYTLVVSENKQHFMILKINSKNPHLYTFTTYLYDKDLQLVDRHRISLPMEDRDDMFSDFALDNEGQLVFSRFAKNASSEYVSRVYLVTKSATGDNFSVMDIGASEHILDEIKLRVDNDNRRYIISGFYYKQRRGNIEGLYTVIWDEKTNSQLKENLMVFDEKMRMMAKSSESNVKMAFNDYFVKRIIPRKDGGYLIISECEFTTSRGNSFNRWDYMNGYSPYPSPMDYYSPFYNPYSPYRGYGYGGPVNRYNSENIMVWSFDENSNLEWDNAITKSQFNDDDNSLISHQVVNTGGELHFLYNQFERRTQLLSDQSISPDGKLTRYPTLRNLDKGYEFATRFGKQIGASQILIPCYYRNYLCFAKLEF